jgi:transposase-like protein
MPRRVQIRSSKYLNNVVEQDHRRVKHRIAPMLGFKRFDTATITISGIELAEKIKKGSVQDRKAGEEIGRSTGNLGGCSGILSESKEPTT